MKRKDRKELKRLARMGIPMFEGFNIWHTEMRIK